MNLVCSIKKLPVDLLYMIANYEPRMLFLISSESEIVRYDWFKLIRMNFGLSFCREDATNEEVMGVYRDFCVSEEFVECGEYCTFVRVDGKLMGCGGNGMGQLGVGDNVDRKWFEEIPGIPTNIVEVVCGWYYTIIRLVDGTLMGTGSNEHGQLGLGDVAQTELFVKIGGIAKNVAKVICGSSHTIIVLTDGGLMGCGLNDCGQLGFGDYKNRTVFEEIRGIPRNVATVNCGWDHTIIRMRDGTLMSSGCNQYGELGLGDYQERILFQEIRGIPKNVAEVTCGPSNTFIRLTNGVVMCCGDNRDGQLGLGDEYERNVFKKIRGVISKVVCGEHHTIIRLTDGTLMSCGSNKYGKLGLGDHLTRNRFEKVPGVANIREIKCCFHSTIIVSEDGRLMSCGQRGLEHNNTTLFARVKGVPEKSVVTEIKCGAHYIIIRLADSTLMACGGNGMGQLGLGDNISLTQFQKITLTKSALPKWYQQCTIL
ncbi:MAG: chromosome condensation regulator [Hyperionvirus sp.]|uniref:Chromosome condensation regulator n=1 Tax=Hyperionvirus sp. TaxID=2487770 RepID=A0A3G5A698_9VIRU|nr:MAG: chromosome condensation regulator [Hyperionvirus sp.]